jgi:formate--tetrahydrofolate ligase
MRSSPSRPRAASAGPRALGAQPGDVITVESRRGIDLALCARRRRHAARRGVHPVLLLRGGGEPADQPALDPRPLQGQDLARLQGESLRTGPDGKLILVTAISPTPAGEGKTTTTVGLGDALNRIGKKAVICLREPSLGPVFGMKGGAAGGGYAQVVPMEDINLHFTGDFNAIALANNLLAAAIDNHIHHGNALGIDVRRIAWKRVMDMNDRALRDIVSSPRRPGQRLSARGRLRHRRGLRGDGDLLPGHVAGRPEGAAGQHRRRLHARPKPVRARDLKAHGAMTVLLKDALAPNLVQTLENNPAFMHGGPFANIAHGCNSVIATRTALKLADYVVTEAGFGADLGAEKFIDIKCRKSGLRPARRCSWPPCARSSTTAASTCRRWASENLRRWRRAWPTSSATSNNVRNLRPALRGVDQPLHPATPRPSMRCCASAWRKLGVPVVLARTGPRAARARPSWRARWCELCEQPSTLRFVYEDERHAVGEDEAIATRIYGAPTSPPTRRCARRSSACRTTATATTRCAWPRRSTAFSTDPKLRGAPSGHVVNMREVRLAAGAEFVVMVCGDIMTMPGLPKVPSAEKIDGPGRLVFGTQNLFGSQGRDTRAPDAVAIGLVMLALVFGGRGSRSGPVQPAVLVADRSPTSMACAVFTGRARSTCTPRTSRPHRQRRQRLDRLWPVCAGGDHRRALSRRERGHHRRAERHQRVLHRRAAGLDRDHAARRFGHLGRGDAQVLRHRHRQRLRQLRLQRIHRFLRRFFLAGRTAARLDDVRAFRRRGIRLHPHEHGLAHRQGKPPARRTGRLTSSSSRSRRVYPASARRPSSSFGCSAWLRRVDRHRR